jgi:hypothetical protein
MIVAHLIAGATAHGGAFTEALVATGPLCLSIRQGDPARLPPRLVTVFVAVTNPWIRAALGELSKAGQHGIVVAYPVLSWVQGSEVLFAPGLKVLCVGNEFGVAGDSSGVVDVNGVRVEKGVHVAEVAATTFGALCAHLLVVRFGGHF